MNKMMQLVDKDFEYIQLFKRKHGHYEKRNGNFKKYRSPIAKKYNT